MSLTFSRPLPRSVGRLRFRRPSFSWEWRCAPIRHACRWGRPAVRRPQKRLPETPEIPETPPGVHPLGETVKPRTRWSSTCGLEAKGRRSTLSISSVKRPVRSVASAPLVGCRLAFLCRRSISDDRAEADFSGIGGRDGPRGAVTTPLAARAAPRIMETQGLFDRPALLMAWQCCCDGGSCSDRYASKHHRWCFARSRPFIPVRKNYLTRRAGAWGLTRKRKVVS